MAGYLSTSHIKTITGAYGTHFITFKKQIVVWKEPIRTGIVVNTSSSPIFGYGEASQPTTSYTYITVSGVFDAQVNVNQDQKGIELGEIKTTEAKGKARIKVEQNCRDFIEDGRKTESIVFAGETYNTIAFDAVHDFFGLKYYIYNLERTT